MEIVVNGKRQNFEVEPQTLVSTILEQLRFYLAEQGQVASAVTLDGTALSPENEQELQNRKAGDFSRLEVQTVTTEQLVGQVLRGLVEAASALRERSSEVGALFQEGKRSEALESLRPFLDDLATFADGTNQCYRYVARTGSLSVREASREASVLRELFKRLNTLLSGNQEVELSDLLLYEVPEALQRWESILSGTADALQGEKKGTDPDGD